MTKQERRAASRGESLPAPDEKATRVKEMFDRIAPRYDLVNRVMTFGLDTGWRRRTVESLELRPGDVVADVACGTGDLCRELARRDAWPVGFDFAFGMLHAARVDVPLVQADGLVLPLRDESVDGLTCGFALRNVTDIAALLREFARVVRPGRRIAILEVSQPSSALLRTGHGIYFNRVVPLIGRVLSDGAAYRYLPDSASYLPPPEELLDLLVTSGFDRVARHNLGLGAAQLLTGRRR